MIKHENLNRGSDRRAPGANHDGTWDAANRGLLDLQVNGYAGVDFNSAALTPDALDHALHAMLQAGSRIVCRR